MQLQGALGYILLLFISVILLFLMQKRISYYTIEESNAPQAKTTTTSLLIDKDYIEEKNATVNLLELTNTIVSKLAENNETSFGVLFEMADTLYNFSNVATLPKKIIMDSTYGGLGDRIRTIVGITIVQKGMCSLHLVLVWLPLPS